MTSPLRPSGSPSHKSSSLPSGGSLESPSPRYTTPVSQPTSTVRQRSSSVSSIQPSSMPSVNALRVTRVVQNPIPASAPATELLSPSHASFTIQRRHSSGPLDFSTIWRSSSLEAPTPPNGESTNWWTDRQVIPRPWEERKQHTIPTEQAEGWARARECVAEAAANVLGTTGDIMHDLLKMNANVLRFPPSVALQEAARSLLSIWGSLQFVDIHRLACLRLTERCATILMSVREDVAEVGDEFGMELQAPVTRLVESFREVHRFLVKQSHRPFIDRYLQRHKIQHALIGCHNSLSDALGMFNLSIQTRILKQVLHAEERRHADSAVLLDTISHSIQPIYHDSPTSTLPNMLQPTGDEYAPAGSAEDVLATLQAVTARQNERDMVNDADDLRQLMHAALQTNDNVEMIRVLQVGRDEMPEVIKTLQRALEVECNRKRSAAEEQEVVIDTTAPAGTTGTSTGEEGNPTRPATVVGIGPSRTSFNINHSRAGTSLPLRDTLDREFMETGIDALRRLSRNEVTLPSWTITRYEVDREEKIGHGFFSHVYKGTWHGRTVAIKVLAETTPRQLFIHEVSIWKTLQHPNVLELLGSSSASSDPPWFFVSPYYRNGSLAMYLKSLPSLDNVDLLMMVHQIAQGMMYLHGSCILHGDLKAANVLVDDNGHCVISDFGQSEMKSEAYRISGMPFSRGTLRWQAPELMSGKSDFTLEIDVYAFAITCVELLAKGALPWAMADDDAVRHFVLREDMRPELPLQHPWSTQLSEILNSCWHRDPSLRPPFTKIDQAVQALRACFGSDVKDSPIPPSRTELQDTHPRTSPDLHPISLPPLPSNPTASFTEDSILSPDTSYREVAGELPVSTTQQSITYDASDPVLIDQSQGSSRSSLSLHGSSSEHAAPAPLPSYNSEATETLLNERRYRMLLQHEFHPSLTLPLWIPSQVAVGAVGYHSKASGGEFITLFSSLDPAKSSDGRAKDIPSVYGYGRQSREGQQRQDTRNVAQRGMDTIHSWLTSTRSKGGTKYSRRYSLPLRAGHKTAHLFTESTRYRYLEDLPTSKKWFKANVDYILALYGAEHHISKEDLYLVIGALDAREYALFVSHEHPDGQVDFNVFSTAHPGQPWGEFSFSFDVSSSFLRGPSYNEPIGNPQWASKISSYGNNGKWESLLLARLRFKPDQTEPTSLV